MTRHRVIALSAHARRRRYRAAARPCRRPRSARGQSPTRGRSEPGEGTARTKRLAEERTRMPRRRERDEPVQDALRLGHRPEGRESQRRGRKSTRSSPTGRTSPKPARRSAWAGSSSRPGTRTSATAPAGRRSRRRPTRRPCCASACSPTGSSCDSARRTSTRERPRSAQPPSTCPGLSDLYVGVKLWLTEQKCHLPEMALVLQALLPTAGQLITSDRVLPGFNFLYGWDVVPTGCRRPEASA